MAAGALDGDFSAHHSVTDDQLVLETRCVIHSIPDGEAAEAELAIKSHLNRSFVVRQCQPISTGKRVKYLSNSFEIKVQAKAGSNVTTCDQLTKLIEDKWSEISENTEMREFWLETFTGQSVSDLSVGSHPLALQMISLGALTSPAMFNCHWQSERKKVSLDANQENKVDKQTMNWTFSVDNELITISWKETDADVWKMKIPFNSLASRTFLVGGSDNQLYLFIANQPKLFKYVDGVWQLDASFSLCSRQVIESSNVAKIEVDPSSRDEFDELLQRLKILGFNIYRGHPETVDALQVRDIQWPKFETFEATYAWHCLTTRGFKVTDQVSGEVLDFLQAEPPENEPLIARLLHAIGENFDNHCIVSLTETTLQHDWEMALQFRDKNGRFADLVEGSNPSAGHLSVNLPKQLCYPILFTVTEKIYAERLEQESKAKRVMIRRERRTGLPDLVVEAFGSAQSLQLIQDIINEQARNQPTMLFAGKSHFAMDNSYTTIFKHCGPEPSLVLFQPYSGPCQPFHVGDKRQGKLRSPRLRRPNPDSSSDREKFVEHSLGQFELISTSYNEHVHGQLRAVISFGTLYLANCDVEEIPDTEFNGLFALRVNSHIPDFLYRGHPEIERELGHYRHFSSSFISTSKPNRNNTRLQTFLHKNGFVLLEKSFEYRLSLKFNISGTQTRFEGDAVLDENFDLKCVAVPDITWLCASVVSSNKDSSYRPYDCRFRIQSCSELDIPQLRRETDDFEDIIARHRDILQLSEDGEICGIHEDFQSRVYYVRKNRTKMYRASANRQDCSTDEFLRRMAIRINTETAYSRPKWGEKFEKVDRVKVTAVPDFPDLHDKDGIRTFLNNAWKFAEELESMLK